MNLWVDGLETRATGREPGRELLLAQFPAQVGVRCALTRQEGAPDRVGVPLCSLHAGTEASGLRRCP